MSEIEAFTRFEMQSGFLSETAMLCQVRRLPTRRNSDNLLLAYDASLIGLAATRVPPAHHSKR
jgi:hypothetical protein